jgi:hypothetical protein
MLLVNRAVGWGVKAGKSGINQLEQRKPHEIFSKPKRGDATDPTNSMRNTPLEMFRPKGTFLHAPQSWSTIASLAQDAKKDHEGRA